MIYLSRVDGLTMILQIEYGDAPAGKLLSSRQDLRTDLAAVQVNSRVSIVCHKGLLERTFVLLAL